MRERASGKIATLLENPNTLQTQFSLPKIMTLPRATTVGQYATSEASQTGIVMFGKMLSDRGNLGFLSQQDMRQLYEFREIREAFKSELRRSIMDMRRKVEEESLQLGVVGGSLLNFKNYHGYFSLIEDITTLVRNASGKTLQILSSPRGTAGGYLKASSFVLDPKKNVLEAYLPYTPENRTQSLSDIEALRKRFPSPIV